MSSLRRLLLGVLVVTSLVLGLPVTGTLASPAVAVPTDTAGPGASAWLAVNRGVLYDRCRKQPYRIRLDMPAGTDTWAVRVAAYGPGGHRVVGDVRFGRKRHGWVRGGLMFCGTEQPGRYTLRGVARRYDFDAWYRVTESERLAPRHFTMRRPHSITLLRASRHHLRRGQKVVFVAASWKEWGRHYTRARYEYVRLQYRSPRGWSTISRTRTNHLGRARFHVRFRGRHPVTFRAYTQPTRFKQDSRSHGVRLR